MTLAQKSKVFVIDDDEAIGQAIAWLLETVMLETKTYTQAKGFLEEFNPQMQGCIVIDVRMPGMSGLELQQRLIERGNLMPIMMISGHADVPMAVRAMQAGAKDFILKPFNDQVLLEKIQALIELDLKRNTLPSAIAERFVLLTPREHEVLKLILDGKLNKQIAAELSIAMSTVELHRARIMEKMQAKSIAELVKLVLSIQKD